MLTWLAVGVIVAGAASAQPKKADYAADLAVKLQPTRQLVYRKAGDRELHLHVFEPKNHQGGDQRPCLITIHGGGWVNGVPRRMYPFADHAAQLGMVGISIEYRLLNRSGVTVFDCVKDGRSAVRYVRANAAKLGIDPVKIVVSGGSAGGHVAVGTALFDGIDNEDDDTKVSCRPDALLLHYPVIDTSTAGYGNARIGKRWRELSPLHQVRAGLPPTITFHGTGDTVTPFKGAKGFHDAMLKAGNRSELVVHEGGKHGYFMFERKLFEDTLRRTEVFLRAAKILP